MKDNLSRNFVGVLKDLKDYDLKDLSTKATEKKSSPASLKNLIAFTQTSEDGTLTLKTEEITKIIKDKQTALIEQNQKVQAKLFETA